MKQILCMHDINIICYIKYMFLFPLDKNSGYYDNLMFPLTYNVNNGNCHLLFFNYRYFYKTFSKMFLEKSRKICRARNMVIFKNLSIFKFAYLFSSGYQILTNSLLISIGKYQNTCTLVCGIELVSIWCT